MKSFFCFHFAMIDTAFSLFLPSIGTQLLAEREEERERDVVTESYFCTTLTCMAWRDDLLGAMVFRRCLGATR